MCSNVACDTRIHVVTPGASQRVPLLQDDEIVPAALAQLDPHQDAGNARTDDDDTGTGRITARRGDMGRLRHAARCWQCVSATMTAAHSRQESHNGPRSVTKALTEC